MVSVEKKLVGGREREQYSPVFNATDGSMATDTDAYKASATMSSVTRRLLFSAPSSQVPTHLIINLVVFICASGILSHGMAG